jgi:amino acid permease
MKNDGSSMSRKTAIVSMITTMFGAGINWMPYVFGRVGYVNALAILALVGIATSISCYFMACAAKESPQKYPTYSSLSSEISPALSYFVSITLFFNSYLTNVNFCKYLSLLLVQNFSFLRVLADDKESARAVVVLLLFAPFLYLVMKKDISSLYITSYITVISVSYIAFLMALFYLFLGSSCAEKAAVPLSSDFRTALPFLISSMVCQANMVKFYVEMEDKSENSIVLVSIGATVGGALINGLTGLCGYLVFGEIGTEILSYLSDPKSAINLRLAEIGDKHNVVSKFAIYSSMLILFGGFPVQFSPLSEIILNYFPEDRRTERARKLTILFLFITCMLIAMIRGLEIQTIKRLTGAAFSSPIAFVYPFIYYVYARGFALTVLHVIGVAMAAASVAIGIVSVHALCL